MDGGILFRSAALFNSLGLVYILWAPEPAYPSLARTCESELRELLDTRANLQWYRQAFCILLFFNIFILDTGFLLFRALPATARGLVGEFSPSSRPKGKGVLQ